MSEGKAREKEVHGDSQAVFGVTGGGDGTISRTGRHGRGII